MNYMRLTVRELAAEDTWKDIVRIKKHYRRDFKDHFIPRGTVCRISCGKNSKWVIVHGRESDDAVIQMDLSVRLALEVEPGNDYDFKIERLSWLRSLWFPWKASDPIYRVPAQLSLVSLFLGVGLGLVGILVGIVPLYEEKHGRIFAPPSSESSAAPGPSAPSPARAIQQRR